MLFDATTSKPSAVNPLHSTARSLAANFPRERYPIAIGARTRGASPSSSVVERTSSLEFHLFPPSAPVRGQTKHSSREGLHTRNKTERNRQAASLKGPSRLSVCSAAGRRPCRPGQSGQAPGTDCLDQTAPRCNRRFPRLSCASPNLAVGLGALRGLCRLFSTLCSSLLG